MIIIWAKPGTLAAQHLRVRGLRHVPMVGETFEAKPVIGRNGKVERYTKWERWLVTSISFPTSDHALHVLERM